MTEKNSKERSIRTDCLQGRIEENRAAQQVDFNEWIFNCISINHGDHVLELCCGTGAQTVHFLSRTGNAGKVIALDISRESLEILRKKVSDPQSSSLLTIESDLDQADLKLKELNIPLQYFDVIFCSYGLYYSQDARGLLTRIIAWLKPAGSIVIVGPFGPNNDQLYKLLAGCGVIISDYIRYTSQEFMNDIVIPFGVLHFNSLKIRRLVNNIYWSSAEQVFRYWENTTFYDETKKRTGAGPSQKALFNKEHVC